MHSCASLEVYVDIGWLWLLCCISYLEEQPKAENANMQILSFEFSS